MYLIKLFIIGANLRGLTVVDKDDKVHKIFLQFFLVTYKKKCKMANW